MLVTAFLVLARVALIAVALAVSISYVRPSDHREMTAALTRDVLFDRAPASRPREPSRVVLVTVGAPEALGRQVSQSQSVDRRIYARAIDALSAAGARVILLGPTFNTPADPASDEALEAAIRRSGRVLLGERFRPYPGPWAEELVTPLGRFARAAAGVGYTNMFLNIDGVMRNALYETTAWGRRFAHIALVAAAWPLDRRGGSTAASWTGPGPAQLGVPLDPYGLAVIDMPAIAEIPRVGLTDLASTRNPAAVRSIVGGRTVVIGESGPFRHDEAAYHVTWPAGRYVYGEGGWLLSVVTAAVLGHHFLDDLWPRLGVWPVLAVALLAALLWRLQSLATAGLGLALFAASWAGAAFLRPRGLLLDAYALTEVIGILAGARLVDIRLGRVLQIRRLTRMLTVRTRIAGRPASADTRPAREELPAPDGLDVVLLAELLPSRYGELSLIGAGGMGLVYRARDTRQGTWIALKVLRPTAHLGHGTLSRFLAEIRLLQRLSHPGLVRIHDVHLESIAFFTMELVDGLSLDRKLARTGPMAPLKAVLIAREIGEILAYVHANGVFHRDVKPSNVMILEDGSVKLLDLGVARDTGATGVTLTGDVVGTLRYMAPEQLTAVGVSAASDVYGVGVVLCELITGAVPLRDGVAHVVSRDELLGRGASEELVTLIGRLLDPRPSVRPSDGTSLIAALDAVAATVDRA